MPKTNREKGHPTLSDGDPDRRPLATLPTNRGRPFSFFHHITKGNLLQESYPIQKEVSLWIPIHETANYKVLTDGNKYRFRFCCSISGGLVHTTEWITAETMETALRIAWEMEGKNHFNRCSKCGKWVSDVMFNADVLECVACTPWEDIPKYCPSCGNKLSPSETRCSRCDAHLRYEGR